ncbi:hypothetical protein INTERNEXUS_208 [Bacillus phage vB_BspM_Internexus]|nr:hypothetical protein INTERNEXUS_208 [Bacillus phage vB_BspM_Internexus]
MNKEIKINCFNLLYSDYIKRGNSGIKYNDSKDIADKLTSYHTKLVRIIGTGQFGWSFKFLRRKLI